MRTESKCTLIEIQCPRGITPEHFKLATPILKNTMDALKDNDEAMRGYIAAANKDGFPVKSEFATSEQLQEICMRAFWWAFERITSERQ